ncbi:MAG: DUF2771 domain-containing protein [Actinomycetota bacterium]|nr:DUF2771 domain-containing protein [Actinomycetota bacterium]
MTRPSRGWLLSAISLVLIVSACSSDAAPTVSVTVGDQQMDVEATQYCLDGEGKRYAVTPQVLQVEPDETILIEVPEDVAESGWSFQVYEQGLQDEDLIGEVDVGAEASYELSTSDAVPAAYYLVIVQDSGELCDGLAGAWPVGFLRGTG